jgi:AcrR family transcriptional regulator
MAAITEQGTRERILRVAEAFLGDHGYHGTRLHEIAERVGIQKASLFHHFASKEHLYRAVLDAEMVEIDETIRGVLEAEGDAFDKIGMIIDAYVDMVATRPERTKILLRQSLGDAPATYEPPPESRHILDMMVAFISDGQRARVFAPVDPLALVLSVAGMVAFFFTSAPVLAPAWFADTGGMPTTERVKRHVGTVVQRCLQPTRAANGTAGEQEY